MEASITRATAVAPSTPRSLPSKLSIRQRQASICVKKRKFIVDIVVTHTTVRLDDCYGSVRHRRAQWRLQRCHSTKYCNTAPVISITQVKSVQKLTRVLSVWCCVSVHQQQPQRHAHHSLGCGAFCNARANIDRCDIQVVLSLHT